MFIKKIILNQFQKHEHLELSFTEGVNYLYGQSDAGKSCIRRAIAWVFGFENYSESTIRRTGSKVTSVIVILNNGAEVERVRSATINRFIVRKDGSEKIYDSVGKQVPDEVKAVLQTTLIDVDDKEKPLNLNIAEQIALPFLMDKSPSYRLKLFNKLTGSDLIDKVLQNFNKAILQIGRDIKVEQEFITTNKPKLEEVTIQHAKESSLYDNFKIKREAILKQVDKYNSLFEVHESLRANASQLIMTRIALNDYKVVPEELIGKLKVLIGKFTSLNTIKVAYEINQKNIASTTQVLLSIKECKVDTKSIQSSIERLSKLTSLKKQISDNFDQCQKAILTINDTNGNIKILDTKYTELLKEAKVCPTCKQSTCKEH